MATAAPSSAQREFQEWKNTATLCRAGRRDEALLLLVSNAPFSSPNDVGFGSIAERGCDDVILFLDELLPWCRMPRLQAERVVRLVRSGQLKLHVHTFRPNSPEVLDGRRAKLQPVTSLAGLPPARQQPAEGFSSPHHVRASLHLGPKADMFRIRRLIAELGA
jgi:hypothetical protein